MEVVITVPTSYGDDKNTYLIGLYWGLTKLIYGKGLKQCYVKSECNVSVSSECWVDRSFSRGNI